MMTYTASSSYKMNEWCDVNNMNYTWTYDYMDEDSRDFEEDQIMYKSPLASNKTFTT